MKHIVLVTHADFAKGILTSLELVMGKTDFIDCVSISASETIPEITAMIERKMNEFQREGSTVIISDIAGGSTTQAALGLIERKEKTYVITGLNLGLLLEVALLPLTGDDQLDRQAFRNIIENSKNAITLVNDSLEEQKLDQISDLDEL